MVATPVVALPVKGVALLLADERAQTRKLYCVPWSSPEMDAVGEAVGVVILKVEAPDQVAVAFFLYCTTYSLTVPDAGAAHERLTCVGLGVLVRVCGVPKLGSGFLPHSWNAIEPNAP